MRLFEAPTTGFETLADGCLCVLCCAICRSIWAVVDGGLHEYDLEGRLLRAMPKDSLEALGLQMITSVAQYSGRKLLLGSQKGNRVFAIDTAPEDIRESAFEMACSAQRSSKAPTGTAAAEASGMSGSIEPLGPLMGCSDDKGRAAEPQGESFENEVARGINAISVEWDVTLPRENFLEGESLVSIEYDDEKARLLYVVSVLGSTTSKVFSYSLNGGLQGNSL